MQPYSSQKSPSHIKSGSRFSDIYFQCYFFSSSDFSIDFLVLKSFLFTMNFIDLKSSMQYLYTSIRACRRYESYFLGK